MSTIQPTYDEIQPWLNADEYILLASLDPSYKRVADVKADLLNQNNFNMYMAQKPDKYELSMPSDGADMGAVAGLKEAVTGEGTMMEGEGVEQEGGFLPALIPFLPMIGSVAMPLINKIIGGISSIFRRKKKTVPVTPGAPVAPVTGQGISGGALLSELLNQNIPYLQEVENTLKTGSGKQFWRTMDSFVADNAQQVLSRMHPEISGPVMKHAINMQQRRMLPKSFMEVVNSEKHEGRGMMNSSPTVKTIMPVMKWVLSKMVDKNQGRQLYKTMKPSLVNEIAKDEASGGGLFAPNHRGNGKVGDWFGRMKRKAKDILLKVLPTVGKIATSVAGPAIETILGKIGVSNDSMISDISHKMGNMATDKLNEQISKVSAPVANQPDSQLESIIRSGVDSLANKGTEKILDRLSKVKVRGKGKCGGKKKASGGKKMSVGNMDFQIKTL